MPREDKPLQLRPVDDEIENPVPVVRLANRETREKEAPVRLGPSVEETAESRRLALPSREEIELRTHQPGIEAIIEPDEVDPDLLEQNWGEESAARNPIPWGWFALIGLVIFGALLWSLSHVEKAEEQADHIRIETAAALVDEEREEREATLLVNRIERSLRNYFKTTSVESLIPLVRHQERVGPLMRRYYGTRPMHSGTVDQIQMLQPLTLDNRGEFWMASVSLTNGNKHNLLIEVDESGNALMDWETLVCYQPIPWDEFALRRPAGESMDFRVYVEADNFYSHEFADAGRWASFRLTALDSEETLFGYAPADSPLAAQITDLIRNNGGQRSSLILRLSIPEGLKSRRGLIIEKVLSPRWLYLNAPDSGA